ncbi:MAG: AI-2E family transporter [Lachnospiraceae bacterium]|jgi:predicted PurR-regulated permease PerM|nr:AI-2E family transporter [Lachnospiraceae bacterium]
MSFKGERKYFFWGLTAFSVIAASMVFYDLLFSGKNIATFFDKTFTILRPITYGLVLGYLFTPVVNWMERCLFTPICKKAGWASDTVKAKKRMRGLSISITLVMFISAIYGLISMIIPQLVSSITSIATQLPTYEKNLENFITKLLRDNPQIETMANSLLAEYSTEFSVWLNKLLPQLGKVGNLLKEVSASLLGLVKILFNLVIGIILSIYVLSSKEVFAAQAKKIIYALFEQKSANQLIKDFRAVNKTFGGYISAKLLDSLIIGILCFIGISILGMPYTVLIAVIVGVTNIIPFFGPYIGAIPSIILILMVDPVKALYFTVFVLILQQFDGNILGPKLLGDSTGLSSFWVVTSITLFGGHFGIIGMAIGVPVFAVIYAGVRRWITRMLTAKKLATNTEDYMNLSEIRDHEYIEIMPPNQSKNEGKDPDKVFEATEEQRIHTNKAKNERHAYTKNARNKPDPINQKHNDHQ